MILLNYPIRIFKGAKQLKTLLIPLCSLSTLTIGSVMKKAPAPKLSTKIDPEAIYAVIVNGRRPRVHFELSEREARVVYERILATTKDEVKIQRFQPSALIATTNPNEVFRKEETEAFAHFFAEALPETT